LIESSNQWAEDIDSTDFGNTPSYDIIRSDSAILYANYDIEIYPNLLVYYYAPSSGNLSSLGIYNYYDSTIQLIQHEDLRNYPICNSGGMYVALRTDNQLWQFDVSAGFIRTLTEDPGPVSDYSISEDSKLLYSTTSLTGIYNSIVVDSTLDTAYVFDPPYYYLEETEWSYSGNLIAFCSEGLGILGTIDGNTYQIIMTTPFPREKNGLNVKDIVFGIDESHFYWNTNLGLFKTDSYSGITECLEYSCTSNNIDRIWSSSLHDKIFIKRRIYTLNENFDLQEIQEIDLCDSELENCQVLFKN